MTSPNRFAAISDIHGNLHALEAVLERIRSLGDIELTVNLGDILSGPIEPAATADLLISLDLPTIRGNHERQLLDCARAPGGASDQFAFEETTAAHRSWLAALPATLPLGEDVLLSHGTPHDDLEYLLETVTQGGSRLATGEEVASRLGAVRRSLILCGHSHIPRAVSLADGTLVVNPGSVGIQAYTADQPLPHEVANGSPHARFAVYERGPHGWSVSQQLVAYDWDRAAEAARRHGRPDWASRLLSGRNEA